MDDICRLGCTYSPIIFKSPPGVLTSRPTFELIAYVGLPWVFVSLYFPFFAYSSFFYFTWLILFIVYCCMALCQLLLSNVVHKQILTWLATLMLSFDVLVLYPMYPVIVIIIICYLQDSNKVHTWYLEWVFTFHLVLKSINIVKIYSIIPFMV